MAEKKQKAPDFRKGRPEDRLAAFDQAFGTGLSPEVILKEGEKWIQSSGSIRMDGLLNGGWRRRTITEIFGGDGCLDGDTFVQYTTCGPDGTLRNCKGGSLSRLHERFHRLGGEGRGKYPRPLDQDAVFYAPSMNAEGRIFQNRILDVVRTGRKECFLVATHTGHEIVATGDHKFWTGERFVPLSELTVGSTVYLHNHTPYRVADKAERKRAKALARVYLYVKHHPVAGVKVVADRYTYHRLLRSRATVEARMNGLPLDAYVERLNAGTLEGLVFLSREQHVHHLDENAANDSPDNLVVMEGVEHNRMHTIARHNDLRFAVVADVVTSITPVGERETYDLKMGAPFNNYIANGIVVHNSGKTTLALSTAGSVQMQGGRILWLDYEKALDGHWARTNGLDIDHPSFRAYEPNYGEDGYTMAEAGILTGSFDLIVIDSAASMKPRVVLDGGIEDQHVGQEARLHGNGLPRLLNAFDRKGADAPHVLFINQAREKMQMGGGRGAGGVKSAAARAFRHYCHTRVMISGPYEKKEKGDHVEWLSYAQIIKCRYAPMKQIQIQFHSRTGIDTGLEVLEYAEGAGYIHRAGSSYYYLYNAPVDFDALRREKREKDPNTGFLTMVQGTDGMKSYLSQGGWRERLWSEAITSITPESVDDSEGLGLSPDD